MIIITNLFIYNFDKKSKFRFLSLEMRRYIPITQLAGLTKALNEKI